MKSSGISLIFCIENLFKNLGNFGGSRLNNICEYKGLDIFSWIIWEQYYNLNFCKLIVYILKIKIIFVYLEGIKFKNILI